MFDAKRFLKDNFQNAGGVVAHCRAAGVEAPSDEAAQKWFERGSLTGEWLARLLFTLEAKQGPAVSLRPWMEAVQ